jgi:sensor c-di-GMP phosphodiesterase-like protein
MGISIDDYGSGLSSLGYLKNIPADELKVDKMFVLNLAADRTDASCWFARRSISGT